MNTLKRYIILLLVIALVTLCFESVRSFFLANVIQPLALVVWAAWRVIVSVDQIIYWILLIVVCFILVMRLIPHSSENQIKAAYNYTYKTGNRVEYWKTLMIDFLLGEEESENLRDQMRRLLLSVMQDQKESVPLDLKNIVQSKKVPLSLETQHFLFPPEPLSRKSFSLFNHWLLLPAWLRNKIRNVKHPHTKTIDEILGWIETEMEINNDR